MPPRTRHSTPPPASGRSQGQPDAINPLLTDSALERSVLGAILIDNGLYYQAAASGLMDEDFSQDANRRIFAALGCLFRADKGADLITLTEQLGKTFGDLKAAVGGVAYISDLTTGVVRGNIGEHVEVLREKRLRRQALQMAERLSLMAQDASEPIKFVLNGIAEDALAASG